MWLPQLDMPAADRLAYCVRVIRLQHANAKQIAEVMRSLVSGDGAKPAAAGERQQLLELAVVELSLIADESQNALVIKS